MENSSHPSLATEVKKEIKGYLEKEAKKKLVPKEVSEWYKRWKLACNVYDDNEKKVGSIFELGTDGFNKLCEKLMGISLTSSPYYKIHYYHFEVLKNFSAMFERIGKFDDEYRKLEYKAMEIEAEVTEFVKDYQKGILPKKLTKYDKMVVSNDTKFWELKNASDAIEIYGFEEAVRSIARTIWVSIFCKRETRATFDELLSARLAVEQTMSGANKLRNTVNNWKKRSFVDGVVDRVSMINEVKEFNFMDEIIPQIENATSVIDATIKEWIKFLEISDARSDVYALKISAAWVKFQRSR